MKPVAVFMERLLVYFLRRTDEGRRFGLTICLYLVVSQVTFWLSIFSVAFLAPFVKNVSMWLRYTGDIHMHIPWWIVVVTIIGWIVLALVYQLVHALVLFGCIRGCGYSIRLVALWGRFIAGVNGQYVMSMLVVIGSMIILAILPDIGFVGALISLGILFMVPVLLVYFAIWYTYQSYRLTVIQDIPNTSEADSNSLPWGEDGIQAVSVEISNRKEIQRNITDMPKLSKLPVGLYFMAIAGLWMLLLAVLDTWAKN